MTLTHLFYTAALRLATPVLLAHFRRRTRRQTGRVDDWRARLGHVASDERRPVWLHAASAGEMQSVLPLAARLAEHYPVRLSAFTASGLARAESRLPEAPATLAPIDTPGAWRRFLDRTQPRLLVLAETELWPNMLAACAQRHIPAVLVSARLTPAGARRLGRFPATIRTMLNQLSGVFAQGDADLARFLELGLPEGKGRVTGNLKTALSIPASALEKAKTLRTGPFSGRKVWVAGSVREGEETFVADTASRIRRAIPESVALIVPRHPERAPAFIGALQANGIDSIGADALDRREPVAAGTVIVVDRLGVLLTLYAAGEAAFVGGSIAPIGGHNLLEPALLGRPVLAGPHLDNVRDTAGRLEQAGGLVVTDKPASLAEQITRLLQDQHARGEMGEAAHDVASQPGALDRTLAALAPFVEAAPCQVERSKTGHRRRNGRGRRR